MSIGHVCEWANARPRSRLQRAPVLPLVLGAPSLSPASQRKFACRACKVAFSSSTAVSAVTADTVASPPSAPTPASAVSAVPLSPASGSSVPRPVMEKPVLQRRVGPGSRTSQGTNTTSIRASPAYPRSPAHSRSPPSRPHLSLRTIQAAGACVRHAPACSRQAKAQHYHDVSPRTLRSPASACALQHACWPACMGSHSVLPGPLLLCSTAPSWASAHLSS